MPLSIRKTAPVCSRLLTLILSGVASLAAADEVPLAQRCLNFGDPALALPAGAAQLGNPILFVTQFPLAADLENRFTTFGNHRGETSAAGRGGDLWLLYPPDAAAGIPEGCLRNLTREAGFGEAGEDQAGSTPIALREPRVHWDGERALFAMVQGAPAAVGNPRYYWQIYEVHGLGLDAPLSISRVDGQPVDYNNVSPVYGADEGTIYFTSDQARSGPAARHLYPQQDEYERNESVSGLWRLDRGSGVVSLLAQHPSGSFSPFVDSAGRIILSRWDHLQRDIFAERANRVASEAPGAPLVAFREHFPEPLPEAPELPDFAHAIYGDTVGFNFKHFFLWQLQADGSGEEILNHLGRHELVHFFHRSLDRAGNGLIARSNPRPRMETVENMLHPEEDPTTPLRYVFTDAPHFLKQSGGRLLALQAPLDASPDALQLVPLTDPAGNDPSSARYDGDRFRDPLPLANGRLLASHANPCGGSPACSDDTRDRDADATRFDPNYRFRLRLLRDVDGDGYLEADLPVAPVIARRLRLFGVQQDRRIVFDGELSQLDAVEVRVQGRPALTGEVPLAAPERQVFAEEGVDPAVFRDDLRRRGFALMVVRDATTRDRHDRQQPFNLQVHGSAHGSLTGSGQVFTVKDLQLFQADLVSGYQFRAGRRPLAVPVHGEAAMANPPSDAPPGMQADAASFRPLSPVDGSVAALVPAQRALSWQLTDADGFGLVRERYWISFQPGEIRVCTSCHGPNTVDQLGRAPASNAPEALRDLLRHWKAGADRFFRDGFEAAP
jgi:hypothetical protein